MEWRRRCGGSFDENPVLAVAASIVLSRLRPPSVRCKRAIFALNQPGRRTKSSSDPFFTRCMFHLPSRPPVRGLSASAVDESMGKFGSGQRKEDGAERRLKSAYSSRGLLRFQTTKTPSSFCSLSRCSRFSRRPLAAPSSPSASVVARRTGTDGREIEAKR